MDTVKIEFLLERIIDELRNLQTELRDLKNESRQIAKELTVYSGVNFAKHIENKLSNIVNSIDSLRR